MSAFARFAEAMSFMAIEDKKSLKSANTSEVYLGAEGRITQNSMQIILFNMLA